MPTAPLPIHPLWIFLTRLGESQALMPLALVCAGWLARQPGMRTVAGRWLACLGVAMAVTLGSKIAFMGWGLGHAGLDFTGVSGHAMFASAVYPLMLGLLVAPRGAAWQHGAWAAALGLAMAIAYSRVHLEVHSWSEVIAGLAMGSVASALALRKAALRGTRLPWLVPGVFVAWLLATTPLHGGTPAGNNHRLVIQLALKLSGRSQPYTRSDLHPPPAAKAGAQAETAGTEKPP